MYTCLYTLYVYIYIYICIFNRSESYRMNMMVYYGFATYLDVG